MRQKGGRSKRDRKHKVIQSLKHKHGSQAGLAEASDADLARLLEDSNALILPSKSERPSAAADGDADGADAAAAAAAAPPQKQLSKSQLRKLRRIQEEKEKRERRADVMATLAAHQLKQEELQLLRPVTARGQRETKKQALRRALQLQRAGVDLPTDVRLVQERERPQGPPPGQESEEGSEEEDGSSGGGSGSESEGEGARPAAPAGPPAKKQRTAGGGATVAAAQRQQQAAEQQQEQQEQQQRQQEQQAAALREAALSTKRQLGITEGRDDEAEGGPQPGQRPGRGAMPAGPGGKPRVVIVQRRPEIQEVREGLPITGMEQEVMEAVLHNDVVVLCGETGCGKTTQVPQFLYEAGFGSRLFPERAGAVGVTQPRRVAAISTAERVADELDTKLGAVVGYQVRYDKRVGDNTAIKFMTDGILLREVQEDFLLRRYSAILVDEAHERSLNTDILCGMLSRIVALRRSLADAAGGAAAGGDRVYPLKLIIMSATLRTDDFVQNKRLFPVPPPVVCVPARQYPVTVHFSKRTELHDYVGAAYRKVSQIHRTLPPGGILVFLTGQREVEHLCKKLRAAFNRPARRPGGRGAAGGGSGTPAGGAGASGPAGAGLAVDGADAAADAAAAAAAAEEAAGLDAFSGDAAEVGEAAGEEAALLERLLEENRMAGAEGDAHDDYEDESSGDEEEVVVMGGEGFTPEQIAEAEKDFEQRLGISLTDLKGGGGGGGDKDTQAAGPDAVHVLPLYAMLPPAQQARVFRPPPAGHRLVVVATNVAETSLTIPGIRYVVDAGRSKQRLLETAAGLSRFEVRWVSKASAEQRAGRAGRTGPGHCYRLFSSAHFNDTFPQHSPPEILNTALEGVVLAMKALGVDRVVNFPFPTQPEAEALAAAERCLVALSALDGASGQLTVLGRAMAAYPISPRHARMLLEVAIHEQQQAQQAQQEAAAGTLGSGGSSGGSGSSRLRRALPYAVALAAVLSVDSPFVHIEAVSAGDGEGGGKKGAGGGEADGGEGVEAEGGGGNAAEREEKRREKEQAKKKRQAARAAHTQFRVADSDALSALRALCAFEAAGEDEAFCRRNFLHFRNLREAAALHKQLARTLETQQARQARQAQEAQQATAGGDDAAPPPPSLAAAGLGGGAALPPPPPGVLESLRKALAAGWADQVARRIRSIDYIRSQEAQGKRSRAVRYCAVGGVEEDVFLHPTSALHATAPEYVCYTELVRTAKRPYMAGLTGIEPQWLPDVAAPLCTFSPPLPDPPPFYKPAADQVLCWRDVTFSRHDWQLPRCAARHPDATERCAVFGAALLEGKVLPSFAALRDGLAVPPSMLLRPDMRVHKRASDLLAALVAARVDSRASLAAKWTQSPGFLRQELAACMQKGTAGALLQAWGALQAEAAAAAAPAAAGERKKKRKK